MPVFKDTTHYLINDDVLLSVGSVNALLYNTTNGDLLHTKKKLAELVISQNFNSLPKRAQEMLGSNFNIAPLDKTEIYAESFKTSVDTIYVDITSACNYRCQNCYSYKEKNSVNLTENTIDFIESLENPKKVSIVLLGGEPLLYPLKKLLPLLKSWSERFKTVTIFTNGHYLNEDIINRCKLYNVTIRLTIYSLSENAHDDYVGKQGSFEIIRTKLKKLQDNNNAYKLNLIFPFDDYQQVADVPYVFETPKQNIFLDLLRPGEKDNDTFHANKIKIGHRGKPIKHKSLLKICKDLNQHSCYSGKLAITVDEKLSVCPWDKTTVMEPIDTLNVNIKKPNFWKTPMRQSYSSCQYCEFNALCFDCPAQNKVINSKEKPALCNYHPQTGSYE